MSFLTVHPHARGEQSGQDQATDSPSGSSPRTWGTGVRSCLTSQQIRFIPTHVGNRSCRQRSCGKSSVHPHARGEQFKAKWAEIKSNGSSPRTWGTGCGASPASAASAVHPHARGEQIIKRRELRAEGGSSPRTWGTAGHARHQPALVRFIPTHVGNRFHPRSGRRAGAVHPHARGEQILARRKSGEYRGSSPRTWGTGRHRASVCTVVRFIPTHVGNRSTRQACRLPATVHPHARGEQLGEAQRLQWISGSSPRTWGTV